MTTKMNSYLKSILKIFLVFVIILKYYPIVFKSEKLKKYNSLYKEYITHIRKNFLYIGINSNWDWRLILMLYGGKNE